MQLVTAKASNRSLATNAIVTVEARKRRVWLQGGVRVEACLREFPYHHYCACSASLCKRVKRSTRGSAQKYEPCQLAREASDQPPKKPAHRPRWRKSAITLERLMEIRLLPPRQREKVDFNIIYPACMIQLGVRLHYLCWL